MLGLEEEILCAQQETSDSTFVGLDVSLAFLKRTTRKLNLVLADGRMPPFRDGSFDFVHCYHVLEHINDYGRCVEEMSRVLTNRGALYVATSDRRRLIGYASSAQQFSLERAVRRNVREWLARLTGSFSPEKGHHCGFFQEELQMCLSHHFSRAMCVEAIQHLCSIPYIVRTLGQNSFDTGITRTLFGFLCLLLQ